MSDAKRKLFDAASREERELPNREASWTPGGIRRVVWSADSTRLAYAAAGELHVVRV
jgi:hypothetical protein